jgi:hypothetical protein
MIVDYQINREEKSFVIEQLEGLFRECKELQIKLAKNNYTPRERFEILKEKRRKLEAIGSKFRAEGLKLDSFYKNDIEKIMKILTKELLKLFQPRKRNGARWLFSNLAIPTDDLTQEKLTALSSSRSLAISGEGNCVTCTKKINWWNFFSKRTDKDGNHFCSQKCLEKFYFLYCDKCHNEIDPVNENYQYVYETNERLEIGQRKEKLGVICSHCSLNKCSECSVYYLISPKQFQKLLPAIGEGKEIAETKNEHSSICENCQKCK